MKKYHTIVVDPPWPYDDGFQGSPLPYPSMPVAEIAGLRVDQFAAAGAHLYLWATNRYIREALEIAERWGFIYAATLVWCKPAGQKALGGRYAVTTEFVIHAAAPHYAPPRRIERAGKLIKAARESAGFTRAEVHHRVRGGKKTGLVSNWEQDLMLPNPDDWARLQSVLPELAGVARPSVPPPPRRSSSYFRLPSTWWQWPAGRHSEKPEAFLDLVESVSPGPYLELFARRQRLGWDTWGNEALEHVRLVP